MQNKNIQWSLIASFALIASIWVITFFAFQPAWQGHLIADVRGQYMDNAHHFLKNWNLSQLGYNEYQPGALLFFTSLSPILLIKDTLDYLLLALFGANILCIGILAMIYAKSRGAASVIIFALIIFFMGPILLYRFDLLMGILMCSAILLFERKRGALATFVLGVATLTKIYPFIVLPYFLLVAWQQKGWKVALWNGCTYLLGMAFVLIIYLGVFKGTLIDVSAALAIHSKKPVHVESVWSSFLTVYPLFTQGHFATGEGTWGIFGVAKEYQIGPNSFYNYFWLLPIALYYLFLIVKHKKHTTFETYHVISLLLIFLVFSKILTVQYLLWFLLLVPLLKIPNHDMARSSFVFDMFLMLLIAFLSQYEYPLRYSELLGEFYGHGSLQSIFWIVFLRNSLLVILLTRFLTYRSREVSPH